MMTSSIDQIPLSRFLDCNDIVYECKYGTSKFGINSTCEFEHSELIAKLKIDVDFYPVW